MEFEKIDQENELYNPEASAERLKEIERQEERRQNKKAIPYVIGVIILALFIWWLCSERNDEISISYEGYFFADTDSFDKDSLMESSTKPYTLTVEGSVTYSSKISKKIVYQDLLVTLKDSDGNIIFEGSDSGNCQFDRAGFGCLWMREYTSKDGEVAEYRDLGILGYSKDFKEVYLQIEDGPLYFAAPADNVEEAYEAFCKVNGFDSK